MNYLDKVRTVFEKSWSIAFLKMELGYQLYKWKSIVENDRLYFRLRRTLLVSILKNKCKKLHYLWDSSVYMRVYI